MKIERPRRLDLSSNTTLALVEAVFLGILFASDPFLPVFLTRLGASNFQISLLTSMPAITGLALTLFVGRFLQTRRHIIPWYSIPRLFVALAYTLTGIIPFLMGAQASAVTILMVWGLATLPQVVLMISFQVVMNAISGPEGRFQLLAPRWAIAGITSALMVALMGWGLEQFLFPYNYQILFIGLSLFGGVMAYVFASRLRLPENLPEEDAAPGNSPLAILRQSLALGRSSPAFVSFVSRRFVFNLGMMVAAPMLPIYYVRSVQASDAWIGIINTASLVCVVLGYFFWMRQARRRLSNRTILLYTTFVVSIIPALVASTQKVEWVALWIGVNGLFQAGIDLVLFDELMRSMPPGNNIILVSLAQIIQYISTIAGPMIASALADSLGLGSVLFIGAALRLLGFGLFFFQRPLPAPEAA